MLKSEKIFKIAWDCDGVLAESHEPVLERANQKLTKLLGKNINIIKSDLIAWNALYDKVFALTNDEKLASEIRQFWHTPEILRLSPPNPAAIDVFKRCHELPQTTQCVITTRISKNRQITHEWLEQYLPIIDWAENLHIRQESNPLDGDEFKISQLGEINCMIEDNPTTISLINANLPQCRITYINQPWNADDLDSFRANFRVDFNNPEAIYQSILIARDNFLSK